MTTYLISSHFENLAMPSINSAPLLEIDPAYPHPSGNKTGIFETTGLGYRLRVLKINFLNSPFDWTNTLLVTKAWKICHKNRNNYRKAVFKKYSLPLYLNFQTAG